MSTFLWSFLKKYYLWKCRCSWKFRRSSFVLQTVPETEYSKICLFWLPFRCLFSGSQKIFDSVLSIDKSFFGNSFYKMWLPRQQRWPVNYSYKIFHQQIFFQLFFTMSMLEKQHVFIFVSIFIRNLLPTLYISSLLFMNMKRNLLLLFRVSK